MKTSQTPHRRESGRTGPGARRSRQAPLSEAGLREAEGCAARLAARLARSRNTEKTNAVLETRRRGCQRAAEQPEASEPPPAGHGRNARRGVYRARIEVSVTARALKHGDRCPECGQGNVYGQKEPKVLVRIVGQAPLAATVYSSWSGCAAVPAGRCSRPRSRKAWGRRSTTRPRRR